MSCNCGNHHHNPPHGPGHDCSLINHAFDPNPPAFYGTWNHLHGHDATSRVSVCQPGVHSGLYKKCGPLNCPCDCAKMYTLTGVQTKAKIVLEVKLSYTVKDLNKTITITPGGLYNFDYLDEGEVKSCCGRVTNIYKVNDLEERTNLYKIRVDCSGEYSHNVVVFKTDQIRGVSKYFEYANEDTIVKNGFHQGGTTITQVIKDAIVINAELDSEKNIIKGTIVSGILEWGITVDGVCVGTNSSQHDIVLTGARSSGGEITGGTLLNGVVRSGDINGESNDETGIITNATIKGIISNAVIVNSIVTGVSVNNGDGTIVDPTLENSIVYDATVLGEDMITTGGVTVGNVTTGGVTTGGTARGGKAFGVINGRQYQIEGGVTTGENMVTSGGMVVGGKVTGGTKVGNTIYGATVTGGVAHNGTTTGGTTTVDISVDGYKNNSTAKILPSGSTSNMGDFIAKIVHENPSYNMVEAELKKENRWSMNNYDLVLGTDRATRTELFTNFGRATIEDVKEVGKIVDR